MEIALKYYYYEYIDEKIRCVNVTIEPQYRQMTIQTDFTHMSECLRVRVYEAGHLKLKALCLSLSSASCSALSERIWVKSNKCMDLTRSLPKDCSSKQNNHSRKGVE